MWRGGEGSGDVGMIGNWEGVGCVGKFPGIVGAIVGDGRDLQNDIVYCIQLSLAVTL